MKKFLLLLTLLVAAVVPARASTNSVASVNAFSAELKVYDDKIIAVQGTIDALRARHGRQKVDVKQIRELTAQIAELRRQRRLKAIELSLEAHGRGAAANRESKAETSVPVRVR
ncbi:MAG: hypothetical protein RLZZ350_872 [Verrucomicrobiota bacterium]